MTNTNRFQQEKRINRASKQLAREAWYVYRETFTTKRKLAKAIALKMWDYPNAAHYRLHASPNRVAVEALYHTQEAMNLDNNGANND